MKLEKVAWKIMNEYTVSQACKIADEELGNNTRGTDQY